MDIALGWTGRRLSLLDEFGSIVAFQGDAVVVGGGYSDLEERQWKACGGVTRQTGGQGAGGT